MKEGGVSGVVKSFIRCLHHLLLSLCKLFIAPEYERLLWFVMKCLIVRRSWPQNMLRKIRSACLTAHKRCYEKPERCAAWLSLKVGAVSWSCLLSERPGLKPVIFNLICLKIPHIGEHHHKKHVWKTEILSLPGGVVWQLYFSLCLCLSWKRITIYSIISCVTVKLLNETEWKLQHRPNLNTAAIIMSIRLFNLITSHWSCI